MRRLGTDELEVGTETARSYGKPELLSPRRRWLRIMLLLAALAVIGFVVVFAQNWPFTRSRVTADLEEAMQGRVRIGKFHQTWFPPGCIAEDVTFTGYGNLPNSVPITVRKLTIRGSFHGLFTSHVSALQADGVRVIAPNPGYFSAWKQQNKPGSTQTQSSSRRIIDRFIVVNSVLEFSHGDGKPPLQFTISRLEMSSPDAHGVKAFEVSVHNPKPPGEVQASGHLGPWRAENTGQTAIAGAYSFKGANLGSFSGIAGTLSSEGKFQGTIGQLDVSGKTVTPDFEVKEAGHRIPLVTKFQARVITKNGDVSLESVNARLGGSGIQAAADIKQNEPHKGKVTAVNLLVHNGRIQDFLCLFLKDPTAPLVGRFDFKGRSVLPPEKAPFAEKVQLEGDFGVVDAHLTNPATQAELERLSEQAEGEKDDPPERVLTDLKGHIVLRGGTATFSNLSFSVPGAVAKLQGTYNLVTHEINLRGTVSMKANLSSDDHRSKVVFAEGDQPRA
jgi:AsmA-like C-terminal region